MHMQIIIAMKHAAFKSCDWGVREEEQQPYGEMRIKFCPTGAMWGAPAVNSGPQPAAVLPFMCHPIHQYLVVPQFHVTVSANSSCKASAQL